MTRPRQDREPGGGLVHKADDLGWDAATELRRSAELLAIVLQENNPAGAGRRGAIAAHFRQALLYSEEREDNPVHIAECQGRSTGEEELMPGDNFYPVDRFARLATSADLVSLSDTDVLNHLERQSGRSNSGSKSNGTGGV